MSAPLQYKLQSGFDSWTKAVSANANSICHKSPGLPGRGDEAQIFWRAGGMGGMMYSICTNVLFIHPARWQAQSAGIYLTLHLLHGLTDSVWSRAEMSGANVRLWQHSADKKVKSKCQNENATNIIRWVSWCTGMTGFIVWGRRGRAVLCILVSGCKSIPINHVWCNTVQ